MTCRELTELLIDYVQGELEPAQIEHITHHLSLCPPCEVFVATYRITIQLSRRLPAKPLPQELASKLQAAARRHQEDEGQQ